MSRWRRIGRRSLRWFLRILAALLLMILLLLVLLHVEWGRDYVRKRIVNATNEGIVGELSIDSLQGSILGAPSLQGLRLGSEESPIVEVGSMKIDLSLWDLLDNELTVETLRIDRARIRLLRDEAGEIDLLQSLASQHPDDAEKSEYEVEIRDIDIANSSLSYHDASGRSLVLDALTTTNASVSSAKGSTRITVEELSASLPQCGGLPLRVRGDVHITPSHVEARNLSIGIGDSWLTLDELTVTPTLDGLEATLASHIAPELLACLFPDQSWRGGVTLAASAHRASGEEAIRFDLSVNDGALRIEDGTVAGDLSRASATLQISELRPGTIIETGTPVVASGSLALALTSLQRAKASVVGQLRAEVGGYDIDEMTIELHNTERVASGNLTIRAYGAVAGAKADLHWGEARPRLARGTLSGTLPQLARLPGLESLSGRAELGDTVFEGPLEHLQVQGQLTAGDLAYEQSAAESLALDFNLRDLPSSLAGKLTLDGKGSRYGSEWIGPVSARVETDRSGRELDFSLSAGRAQRVWARLDGSAKRSRERTDIRLETLRLRHKTLDARLRKRGNEPARITLFSDDNIEFRDLRLGLSGGHIDVEGSLHTAIDARLHRVKLAPLLDLVPNFDLAITGAASGTATVSLAEAGATAKARLHASRLRISDADEPVTAKLTGTLTPTTLIASASVESPTQGRASFRVQSRRPKNGRWSRQSTRLLRKGRIELETFDLGLLRPLHPALASLGGILSGTVELGASLGKVHSSLRAEGLRHQVWPSRLSGNLEIHADNEKATVAGGLQDSRLGAAIIDMRLATPGPLHSPWRWQLSVGKVVRDTDITLKKIDLLALQQAIPALAASDLRLQGGHFGGMVRVRDRGSKLRLESSLKDVQIADRPSVSALVNATLQSGTTTLDWLVALNSRNYLSGSATVDAGIATLDANTDRERLIDALRAATFKGRVKLSANAPDLLAQVAGLRSDIVVAGIIEGSGSAEGVIERPNGEFKLSLTEARFDDLTLDKLTLSGERQGGVLGATLRVHQAKGRYLAADLEADVDSHSFRGGKITAKDIDLRLFRPLDRTGRGLLASLEGIANGKLTVAGTWRDPEPNGWFKIRKGAVGLGSSLMPMEGISLDAKAKDKDILFTTQGKSGRGSLKLSGAARLAGLGLEHNEFRVRTDKLPVAVGSLVYSATIAARGELKYEPGLWDIRTTIDRGDIEVPIRSFLGKTRSLHSVGEMDDLVFLSPDDEERVVDLDEGASVVRVRIRADESILVHSRELSAKVDLDMDATFLGATPVLMGTARVVSGHLDLVERRYDIERGKASFRGRIPIDPALDVKLQTDFPELSLWVLATGTLDAPKVSFLADPPDYEQSTLLAILMGQPPAQTDNQQGMRDNALAAFSTVMAGQLQDALAPLLPIDIDVLRVEKTRNDGELYTMGKWINDKWFVGVRHRSLAEELENALEFNSTYKLNEGLNLEGVIGNRGAGGVDLLWSKSWGK